MIISIYCIQFKQLSKYVSIRTIDNRKIGRIYYDQINMGWKWKFTYMLLEYKGMKFHSTWTQSKEELLDFLKSK